MCQQQTAGHGQESAHGCGRTVELAEATGLAAFVGTMNAQSFGISGSPSRNSFCGSLFTCVHTDTCVCTGAGMVIVHYNRQCPLRGLGTSLQDTHPVAHCDVVRSQEPDPYVPTH